MYTARVKEYLLKFRFPAGTSRGVLNEKKSWYLILKKDGITGIGECSVIPGLSPDNLNTYSKTLHDLCEFINHGNDPLLFDLSSFPSIQFGLETALKDVETGGKKELFPSSFTNGNSGIPLNGLIWMGDKDFMDKQIRDKIAEGFRCLKLKIGALDFDSEMDMLKNLRRNHPDIEIRLDANGAFHPDNAPEKLKRLSDFSVHSIEQPIKAGQHEKMADICEKSPVAIALDEELIGIYDPSEKIKLLKKIKPQYIILKPSLLGGFYKASEWITSAGETKTGWWVTSALESNIGLNAISQWTYTLNNPMVHGLGTGKLYENNIPSPLTIKDAKLFYKKGVEWNMSVLK